MDVSEIYPVVCVVAGADNLFFFFLFYFSLCVFIFLFKSGSDATGINELMSASTCLRRPDCFSLSDLSCSIWSFRSQTAWPSSRG